MRDARIRLFCDKNAVTVGCGLKDIVKMIGPAYVQAFSDSTWTFFGIFAKLPSVGGHRGN
jgi:hypothetical protein